VDNSNLYNAPIRYQNLTVVFYGLPKLHSGINN